VFWSYIPVNLLIFLTIAWPLQYFSISLSSANKEETCRQYIQLQPSSSQLGILQRPDNKDELFESSSVHQSRNNTDERNMDLKKERINTI
jgi:hypothetical protein